MSNTIFKAGDEVTCAFYGDRKFILEEIEDDDLYPLQCISGDQNDPTFTLAGQFYLGTTPILTLVRTKEQIEEENKPVEYFEVFYKIKDGRGVRRSARIVRSEEEYLELNSRVKEDYEWLKLRRIE